MPADHADRLAQLARARHQQTLKRAQQALTTMASDGEAITVSLLASKAAVSRSWIYTQPGLLDQIEQLKHNRPKKRSSGRPAVSRASEESLRRRLELAHQRIAQLRAENQELRQSLARTHGQLREAKSNQRG